MNAEVMARLRERLEMWERRAKDKAVKRKHQQLAAERAVELRVVLVLLEGMQG